MDNLTSLDTFQYPFITICILTYNRIDEIETSLSHIKKDLDYPEDKYEIIVVDNNSSDNTSSTIKNKYPNVRLYKLKKNIGISGWNIGFLKGKGKYFLVLDDDSNPIQGVSEAIRFLENRQEIGILACRIKQQMKLRVFPLLDFIGCGVIIRKELISKIGGFARWIFLYSHEWEYTLRCLNAGYKKKNFPGCIIEHRLTKNANYTNRRFVVNTIRNYYSIYHAHFSGLGRLFKILMFSTFTLVRMMKNRTLQYFFEGFHLFLENKQNIKEKPIKKEFQDKYNRLFFYKFYG